MRPSRARHVFRRRPRLLPFLVGLLVLVVGCQSGGGGAPGTGGGPGAGAAARREGGGLGAAGAAGGSGGGGIGTAGAGAGDDYVSGVSVAVSPMVSTIL